MPNHICTVNDDCKVLDNIFCGMNFNNLSYYFIEGTNRCMKEEWCAGAGIEGNRDEVTLCYANYL